jgi:hypothetical protein
MKTKSIFSTIALLSFLTLHSFHAQSQFWEWEEKTALTDSVSDNKNPDLVHTYSEINGEMVAMAWEKSTDGSSTAIYYRNLLDPAPEQEIISMPGVHFTHPKILSLYSNNESIFYLFFESDQNGNQDIYYMKYGNDGQFTGPFDFMTGEADETELDVANESMWFITNESRYEFSVVTWISNGDLYSCGVEIVEDTIGFSAPLLLDSGSCHNPVVSSLDRIFYLKDHIDSSFIYYSWKGWPNYEWDSELFFDEGDCHNLAGDNVTPQYLSWSADSNGVFRNHIASTFAPYFGYRIGPESPVPLDPAVCTIVIGVAPEPWEFYDFYMAFPYPDSASQEIFMGDWGGYEFNDFSQSGTECRNPEYFIGENHPWNYYCFYVYLVWEELRNGHWMIRSSKTIMCYGGIDEANEKDVMLKTWPNPFRDEVTISYTLKSDEIITIEVIDLYGRKVKELYNGKQFAGEQQVSWNGKDAGGNTVPDGIYFILLYSDKISACSRLIKVN